MVFYCVADCWNAEPITQPAPVVILYAVKPNGRTSSLKSRLLLNVRLTTLLRPPMMYAKTYSERNVWQTILEQIIAASPSRQGILNNGAGLIWNIVNSLGNTACNWMLIWMQTMRAFDCGYMLQLLTNIQWPLLQLQFNLIVGLLLMRVGLDSTWVGCE